MNGKIKLEKGILNAVEVLNQILQSHKVEYFIIGAMARDILLKQVYEIDETGLVTEDIDFGVSMLNWDNYTDVVSSLMITILQGTVSESIGLYLKMDFQ